MKYAKFISLLLAVCTVFAFAACGKKNSDTDESTSPASPEKTAANTVADGEIGMLAVYFPYDETSEKAAKIVAESTGAELFALETVNGYSDNADERSAAAKEEASQNLRPALKNKLDSITPYSILFVCTPMWENDLPMAFYTFFEDYDLRDRVIVPVCVSDKDGEDAAADAEKLSSLIREKLTLSAVTDCKTVKSGAEPDADALKAFVDGVLNG